MSIKRMSAVWEHSKHKGSELLLLLALADNASDDGFCWPGVEYLSNKIRMTRQSVINLTAQLEASGEVYAEHNKRDGNRYLIVTGMTEAEIKAGLLRFKYESEQYKLVCQNFLRKAGFTSDVKTFYNRCKITVLHEPSLTVNGPSLPVSENLKSELNAFFGEKDKPTPADIPERVDLTDPAARDAYAARLVQQRAAKKTDEPWTLYIPYRYTPRNGITAEALQRTDYLINTITGLECGSDAARKFWQNGLAQVYQESGGNWQHIEAGIKTAWAREARYRPSNPAGFADEVRKARAAIQQPAPSATGGWFIPGGSSV